MRFIRFMPFVFFFLILLMGCKKDKATDPGFEIGRVNDFITLTKVDTLLNYVSDFAIDLDQDGSFDIGFGCVHMTSAGGINNMESWYSIKDSTLALAITNTVDTVFRCDQYENGSLATVVFFNHNSGYSCNDSDTISTISTVSSPAIHYEGDKVKQTEIWSTKGLYLASSHQSAHWGGPSGPNVGYHIITGNWNNVQEKYILFKKTGNGRDYFGWIKLSVTNYSEIHLLEYAIQHE